MKPQLKTETQDRLKETIFRFADRAHFNNLWDLRKTLARAFTVIMDEEELDCHGVDMLLKLPDWYQSVKGVGNLASVLNTHSCVAKIYVPDMSPGVKVVKFIRVRIIWKGPGEDIDECYPPMLDVLPEYKGFDRALGPDGPDVFREDEESFHRNTTMYTKTKIEIKETLTLQTPMENLRIVFNLDPAEVQF